VGGVKINFNNTGIIFKHHATASMGDCARQYRNSNAKQQDAKEFVELFSGD
jgi:hypothetical protein